MTDAVEAALTRRATGAVVSGGDPVEEALAKRASLSPSAKINRTPEEKAAYLEKYSEHNPFVRGFSSLADKAESVYQMGSSVFATPLSGFAGVGTAATNALGITDTPAADVVGGVSRALTYQPRTEKGQAAAETLASPDVNPLAVPGALGEDWADTATEHGAPPWLSTAIRTGPDALVAALGLRGARNFKPTETVRAVPDAAPTGEMHAFSNESASASAVAPDLTKVSPQIRAKVESIAAKGGTVDRDVYNRVAEADSLGINLSEGQATQDLAKLSDEYNNRAKNGTAERYQEQNQQLIDKLDETRAEDAPNAVGNDHIQNGQALIDAYKAADEPVRADITAKYKALEQANGGQFPVDGGAFVAAADAALKSKMKGRYVPPAIEGDLAEFRNTGAMTFEQFENLRTNLAAESRKADRSGDGNAAHAVSLVREALESLPMTGEAANIKPLADAARNAAKARFDRLKADPAYRAAVDDAVAHGEASPLADDFVSKYVIKGKAANIAKMRENLSADPQAGETIAAGVMNYLKSKAGIDLYQNTGNFSQAGFNKALAEVTPKIDHLLPEATAETLQRIGNVARTTQFQPRGSYVNNSNTFVAGLKEKAATVAEKAGNLAIPGLDAGSFLREKAAASAAAKAARKAWEPGAGLEAKPQKLNELLKGKGNP